MFCENEERLRELYKDGFSEDSDAYIDYFFKHTVQDKNVITTEVDGEIVSCAHIVIKKLSFNGKIIDVPYLVAVSTLTPFRGQNIVKNVIKKALDVLYNRNAPFVILYPFDHNYYCQYGFSTIDKNISTKDTKIHNNFDKIPSNNASDFLKIYNDVESAFDIHIYRDLDIMKEVLDILSIDNGQGYILKKNDAICGYSLQYGDNIEELLIDTNSISNIESMSYVDNVQARLIDIPSALGLFTFDKGISRDLVFNVQDRFFGNKKVHFKVVDGKVNAEYINDTLDSIPTIDITIEELTALVFGRKGDGMLDIFKGLSTHIVDKY